MLIADDIVINPSEAPTVPARTEQSLSELGLTVLSFDPGETASGEDGSNEKTRTLTMTLAVRRDAGVDLPTAAIRFQQIVGQMQEEPESWIKRVPEVGGTFAGPVMYRVRRSPTSEGPRVSLGNFATWQAGLSPDVTLTLVGDIVAYATDEEEGSTHSTTTARQLIYTEEGAKGSARGLRRVRVTNDNSSGDWRGLIFASECRDYSADTTAEPWYECQKLTPKGGAEVKEVSGVKVIQHTALTAGWQAIMSTLISASTLHMTHRGGRRIWMRVYYPGETPGNVQLRLMWRALGSSRWTEDNPVAPVYATNDWFLVDLGSVLPQVASLGNERWEGKLMARALNGSGSIRLRDFYPLPTEQYAVLSEPDEDPIDGAPSKLPGTAEDSSAVGTQTWSNVNNIKADDNVCASVQCKVTVGSEASHYLKATNFGLLIPESATVRGISVEIQKKAETYSLIKDVNVKLIKAGTVQATNKALGGVLDYWPTSLTPFVYGGAEDLWGTTWTPAQVNASNFGVAISCTTVAATCVAEVDAIIVTIHYTEGTSQNRICFASRLIEIRSDGVTRQASSDDVWGPIVPDGFLPYAAPGELEGRTQRTIVIPTQGDLEERADTGSNKLTAQEFTRPGYHVAREAA